MARVLHSQYVTAFGYDSDTASDGLEALEKLDGDRVDLVLLDAQMPNVDGFEVAARIRENAGHADLPIVMVSGLPEKEDRLRAFDFGINDFIRKPVDPEELKLRLRWLVELKFTKESLAEYQASLEQKVEQRTAELREAFQKVTEARLRTYEAHLDTIQRLTLAAEYKDKGTAEHIIRTGLYSEVVAKSLGLPSSETDVMRHAVPMHDVGKLGIPDRVLLKPGKLTRDEMEIMKQHTTIGARILSDSDSPELQMGERIALSHHERWDGQGYPNGVAGEEIPMEGRICAVVDFLDALTQNRSYRPAFGVEETLEMIQEESGAHFDPDVVEALFDSMAEVDRIREELPDTQEYPGPAEAS